MRFGSITTRCAMGFVVLAASAACSREQPEPVVVQVETLPPETPSEPPPRRSRTAEPAPVEAPVAAVTTPPVTTIVKSTIEEPEEETKPEEAAPAAPLPPDPTYSRPALPLRQNSSGATSLGAGAHSGGLIGSSTSGTTNVCSRVGPCYEALAHDLCLPNQTACRAALQPPAVNEDATFCSDQLRKAPEQARPYMIDKPGYRLPGECG